MEEDGDFGPSEVDHTLAENFLPKTYEKRSGETVKRDVYGNVKAKPEAKHNRYSSIHRLSFSICPELAKT